MTLAAGTRLGSYEITAPLGSGGMGEVYRARDPRLGRDVAIKLLPEALASDPNRLARLEREARTVAALNHPNIVVLHSLEEADGVRFLTMELVEGESLDRLVSPGGLPLSRVLELAIPLADALVAAHEKAIVHRDLKPGNVMVTREGRVKVLDFGLAKPAPSEPRLDVTRAVTLEASLSMPGQVVGTLPYMAPEQVIGDAADARTDLFALGIMLYELVTGRRPFEGRSSAELSSAILRDAPAAVEAVRAGVPPDLGRIIGRCLEKDRERRYQTAMDLRDELELLRRKVDPGSGPATRPLAAPASAQTHGVPSIAVLPFVNMSRDEENEYFSDGLAEELLNVLAKIRGLRVAARTSSFHFKGSEEDLAVIGRKLNVATLLEGSVRKSGNRVRIAVQLVKVSDGYHLWSETYDRTLEDIFAVQDDIAQSVVRELRTTLMGETPDSKASGVVKAEVAAAVRGRGENTEAHRLYLQGQYFVDRMTREDMAKGIGYLREALAEDPGHALAWAKLSVAYMNQADFGLVPVAEAYARAREAVERAVALEPDLAEGHSRLGSIRMKYDWDWKGAESSFRRALELAPGSSVVLIGAGNLAKDLGRLEEALGLCRRALEQDPLSPASYHNLGNTCRMAGLLPEAEGAYRKVLEFAPHRIGTRSYLALVLLDQDRDEEALAEAQREPEEAYRLWALAVIHHAGGRAAESTGALRALIDRYAGDSAYQIAEVHAARGEVDAAFEWLERAYAQRDSGLAQMKHEPLFRSLQRDPRWGAFLIKMGWED